MITPADMKKMLAKATRKRTQNQLQKDERVYTTESIEIREKSETVFKKTVITLHEKNESIPQTPTPALMAKLHTRATQTFASLESQELPLVREYSAGGLVFDENNYVAIIARHSRSGHLEWCLPKGHIEAGEMPQETAVREIREETGIIGEIIEPIATIDYWFTGSSQRVHKLVHHFALRKIGGSLSVEGDPDHEAEDAIWVKFDDLYDVLTYPNERKIVSMYARKLDK
ncbi:MAG: NUDIX domain-containing protein [Bifidobacteriaceae bacterium]|nr:NUDIX domain-containing protein [Bifidobacteriaceae bacterium]